jgi:hypothetical protein
MALGECTLEVQPVTALSVGVTAEVLVVPGDEEVS